MIDDIKFSTGDMSGQFELQQPFGINIVMDGFSRRRWRRRGRRQRGF